MLLTKVRLDRRSYDREYRLLEVIPAIFQNSKCYVESLNRAFVQFHNHVPLRALVVGLSGAIMRSSLFT